jgi:hypothetical protein
MYELSERNEVSPIEAGSRGWYRTGARAHYVHVPEKSKSTDDTSEAGSNFESTACHWYSHVLPHILRDIADFLSKRHL